MKRTFTFILSVLFLSATLVGCDKNDSKPETKTEEEAKAALVGKWQRTNFDVDGYANGKFVMKVTDEAILAELIKEMPGFIEFTKTELIMVDLENNVRASQSYTLDPKTSTITVTDDQRDDGVAPTETQIKYDLSKDNNTATITIVLEEKFGVFDALHFNVKLKKIANWPAG